MLISVMQLDQFFTDLGGKKGFVIFGQNHTKTANLITTILNRSPFYHRLIFFMYAPLFHCFITKYNGYRVNYGRCQPGR